MLESRQGNKDGSSGLQPSKSVVRYFIPTDKYTEANKSGRMSSTTVGGNPNKSTRKLTNKETEDRRLKGLWFWCEEKYIPVIDVK